MLAKQFSKENAYSDNSNNLYSISKKKLVKFAVSSLMLGFILAGINVVHASGFLLQEATVANAGTAGAGDGVYTESAAAMLKNPATMSHMGEKLTTINAMVFDLEMKFDNYGIRGSDGNAKSSSTTPTLSAFHARQVNEQVHLGLAMGVVGGANLDYGTNWSGAHFLNEIDLAVAQINPTVSYQLNDQWSFGAGLIASWASLEQTMLFGHVEIDEATDWAFGYQLGVMYRHSDNLDFGLSYRSKVGHDFNTDIKADGQTVGRVSADIDVPEIIDFSMRYGLTEDMNLLSTIQYHRWSAWDRTDFHVDGGNVSEVVSIDRDWDDVWSFAVGTDYRVNRDWRLKTGVSYSTSPQNENKKQWADLPVGKQIRYSAGVSRQWDDYTIDMFYQFADFGSVKSERRDGLLEGVNGTLDGRVHFIGMNLTF